MSERDKRVKAFEKLMRSGLSSTDVFCMKTQLMAMGFFTAPASTKYHGNYEGGLFDHSFTVTSSLLSLTKRMGLNWKRKATCVTMKNGTALIAKKNYSEFVKQYLKYNQRKGNEVR